jgi:hypothetical protein
LPAVTPMPKARRGAPPGAWGLTWGLTRGLTGGLTYPRALGAGPGEAILAVSGAGLRSLLAQQQAEGASKWTTIRAHLGGAGERELLGRIVTGW